MSEQRLRNFYLPPFKAALNGSPGCGNSYLMNDILKGEWRFDGFVESDWTAVAELRACPPVNPDEGECGHGVGADGPDAAALALNSGVDSEMTSTLIRDFGRQLLREGRISMRRIDDAVRRILRVKFRAGLFEHPYSRFTPEQAEEQMLRPDAVAAARNAASRSMVLLKNDDGILPLDPSKKTAVIGPLADNQHDMLGPWWGRGDDADVVSVFDGIAEQSPGATFAEGCTLSNKEVPDWNDDGCGEEADFSEAVAVAEAADQVVLALGETREMSGEANARSTLDLPGRQEELIRAIRRTGNRSPSCCSTAARSRWKTSSTTRRRSSRHGSRACRRAQQSPMSSSARSTRAASCRPRSRTGSARCRSTTTVCRPGVRAIRA
jgi:beta-glucosidase